jgi:hypothetical protein
LPRLCEVYPGICLTTEEKARKNFSQDSRRMPVGTMKTEYTEQSIQTIRMAMMFNFISYSILLSHRPHKAHDTSVRFMLSQLKTGTHLTLRKQSNCTCFSTHLFLRLFHLLFLISLTHVGGTIHTKSYSHLPCTRY